VNVYYSDVTLPYLTLCILQCDVNVTLENAETFRSVLSGEDGSAGNSEP
jgi:hypothetical protein